MNGLWAAAERMCGCIAEILAGCAPSIYLYGSAALDDFRPGWSDVDLLVLTREEISEAQAERLVGLRQELLAQEPDNGYYRAFEGGMRSLAAFVSGAEDRVVYWGTSGQRIARNYSFDSFCRSELLDSGRLLIGEDVRGAISRPGMDELRADVRRHCASIREYGALTGRSLYSFGWMLDISRCLYTLRTGRIIAKTAAGEWALAENLCPNPDALELAVKVRREPMRYRVDAQILDAAAALNPFVQAYAGILERELARAEP